MKLTHLRGLPVLAAAALLSIGSQASAFLPVEEGADLEIRLPAFDTNGYMSPSIAAGMTETQRALTADLGGAWKVRSWNTYANSPHSVFGSGADIAAPLSSSLDAESAARGFLAGHALALKLDPQDLRLNVVSQGMGKYAVHFTQTYEGLEVIGGRAHTVLMDTGRLFVMGSDFYSIETLSPVPGLSESEATQIAISDLPFEPSVDRVQEGTELLVLPYPTAVDQVEFRLVYRLRVETANPLGIWVTHVDAHTGEILWRYNDVHFFSGTTEGGIQQDTYCNGETQDPLGYMEVTVSGQGTTTSDGSGAWSIGPGSGSATVTSRFYGPYCDVNRSSGGSDAQFSGNADGGVPFPVDWQDANSRQDERDTFESVSDVHDFIRTFDPGFGYINQRIIANVGVSGTCNAFWNGTINFYNAGGGCANTGEIQGVVHHEFGHGVQASILNGSQGNEGLGEGNSDVLANFITGESIVGRGFYQDACTAGIRNSDNTLQYPENLTGEVHADGEIIAGVVWDVWKNLEMSMGEGPGFLRAAQLWHFGRTLQHPFNQPDQVFSMFVADDDNGDLSDGTPHYAEICVAARKHDTNGNGYDCPAVSAAVTVIHTGLTTPQTEGPADVVCQVTTTGGPIVDVVLHYNRNGADLEATLSPTGPPGQYGATLTLQEGDQFVYYIAASNTDGDTGVAPEFAPFFNYEFDVPTVWDPIETDAGWSVNDEGTDNATTGVWERVDPIGTSAQPEDDHTVDGTICWITGQSNGGGDGGNDIDGGTTTLFSPVYDLSAYENVLVKYFRWYSNSRGADPNNDLWIVQVRNNGGAWTDVENTQDDQGQWKPVVVDLVSLLGNPGAVEFRFIGSDLNAGSLVEAGVDDFEILASSGTTDAPDLAVAVSFALYGAHPNPAQDGTTVSFRVPGDADVAVAVFDVAGRKVRTLAADRFAAGLHQIAWDERDDRGNRVLSGVYFVRMQANEFTASRSVVISR